MIYAIIITAAASGWAIYQTVVNRALVREVAKLEYVYRLASDNADRFADALQALRSRCFITNERGHRVRYVNASPEARAKAEGIVK